MAIKIWGATSLTGGGAGALDAIDGDLLFDGHIAFVGIKGANVRVFALDAASGAAESSPDIIAPDTNPGTKRWIAIDAVLRTLQSNLDANSKSITSIDSLGVGVASPGAKIEINTGATTTVGQIIKGVASQLGDLLQISSSAGTGDIFVVKPDFVGVFKDSSIVINSVSTGFTVDVTNYIPAFVRSDNNDSAGNFFFAKDKAGAAVASGTNIGRFWFSGYDGDTYEAKAAFGGVVDGTVSDGVVPTAITFLTSNSSSFPSERMRIGSSGNVGIGITDPLYKIHIADTSNYSLVIESDNATQAGIFITNTATNAKSRIVGLVTGTDDVSSGAGSIEFQKEEEWTSVASTRNSFMSFRTRLSNVLAEKMRIDSSGNVGINETSPDYKLDVNGDFGFSPGSSVTPVDNGDVVIEATDNTTLTFKLKGSDGTVRSGTLTLS